REQRVARQPDHGGRERVEAEQMLRERGHAPRGEKGWKIPPALRERCDRRVPLQDRGVEQRIAGVHRHARERIAQHSEEQNGRPGDEECGSSQRRDVQTGTVHGAIIRRRRRDFLLGQMLEYTADPALPPVSPSCCCTRYSLPIAARSPCVLSARAVTWCSPRSPCTA